MLFEPYLITHQSNVGIRLREVAIHNTRTPYVCMYVWMDGWRGGGIPKKVGGDEVGHTHDGCTVVVVVVADGASSGPSRFAFHPNPQRKRRLNKLSLG